MSEEMNPRPEADQAETLKEKKRKRRLRALRDLLVRIVLLCLVLYILFFHLVGLTVMPTGDMYPRIDAGDLLLFYRLEQNIRAQDIIVFEKPAADLESIYAAKTVPKASASSTRFVCRVVAGPGDTVEISGNERLVVNGNTMVETNIFSSTPVYEGFVTYPITLGENEFFVLADSRNGGADSRFFGPVKKSEILGTVITILRRNNL